jgi:hypothetical protein
MSEAANPQSQNTTGVATDAMGNPVIDPTKNVLDLVGAAIQRQDDLRSMELSYIREMIRTRDAHARELRHAESERLDAIRAVDVNAVQRAAEVQQEAANALAQTVAASAEAMRTQVASTTQATQTSQATALEPITKAIEDLRRAQYETQGQKNQVVESHASGANIGVWLAAALGTMGVLTSLLTLLVLLLR